MNRNIFVGFVFLLSIAFGLSGCSDWKPMSHSIGKHGKHHHGTGATAHKNDHPND